MTSGRERERACDGNESGGAFVYTLAEAFTPRATDETGKMKMATDENRGMKITELETNGEHKLLLTCADEGAGYRGVIAV